MKRRTTRNFRDEPLSRDVFGNLVKAVAKSAEFTRPAISARIAKFQGDVGTLYDISRTGPGPLERQGELEREQVVANSIGQFPLRKAGAVLWLCVKADCDAPASYCDGLLALGRIGQHICLHCTRTGLGVFLTPAIIDDRTQDMLALPSEHDDMIYLFAFGWPEIGAGDRNSQPFAAYGRLIGKKQTYIAMNTPAGGVIISSDGRVRRQSAMPAYPDLWEAPCAILHNTGDGETAKHND
ncbi:MAG: hypothetical protein V6Z86_01735 [Hyphomicrobiales bacterium]